MFFTIELSIRLHRFSYRTDGSILFECICVIRIWFTERIHTQAHTSITNSLERFNPESLTFWQYHFHMDSRIEGRGICFATKIGYSFALSPH